VLNIFHLAHLPTYLRKNTLTIKMVFSTYYYMRIKLPTYNEPKKVGGIVFLFFPILLHCLGISFFMVSYFSSLFDHTIKQYQDVFQYVKRQREPSQNWSIDIKDWVPLELCRRDERIEREKNTLTVEENKSCQKMSMFA